MSRARDIADGQQNFVNVTGDTMTGALLMPDTGVDTNNDTSDIRITANSAQSTAGVAIKLWGKDMASWGGDIHYLTDSRGVSGQHRFWRWDGSTFLNTANLDSVGRLALPYQPSFKAGLSTSYAPGAGSDIVFNDTSNANDGHFNIGGHYNSSNGRFTAPVGGRYIFTTLVIYEALANGQAMDDVFYLRRNNITVTYSFRRGEYVDGYTGNGGYYVDHANIILNLSAGDYVTVNNGRFNLTVHGNSAYTWFAGYFLG